ncbi:MAG: hypothetical protein DMG48_05180 [Acidobacteria bacterium]|nr:MAG: hypothetical protein DMG48_05180 [Acidobacteriota bacterium]
MGLKKNLYSIEETERLLSLTANELGLLARDGELKMESMYSAESILEFAKRKKITLAPEAGS